MNNCQPPNCPCYCPAADLPVVPILAPQGGPGAVIDIPIYGTQPFSVSIVTNPLMATSNTPVIALVQMHSGNILRVTTGSPGITDTIAGYDALLRVCNACGQLDIPIRVDVVADINPVVTDCLLAQQLWVPELRVPTVGDTMLSFTPNGCRALLPQPDACTAMLAFPGASPQLIDTVYGSQGGSCVGFSILDILALYDTCAALNNFAPGAPLSPVDRLIAIQGATCVTTTPADISAFVEANLDICTILQNLPNAVVQPTAVFYGQQAGQCFEFAVADLAAIILNGASGSCALPRYSFAADPTSGVFFDPASPVTCTGGTAVVIGWQNCDSRLDVGESIRLTALSGDFLEIGCSLIAVVSGSVAIATNSSNMTLTAAADVIVAGSFVEINNLGGLGTFRLTAAGEWRIASDPGLAGQIITSAGPGLPPTWQTPASSLPDLYAENPVGFVAPTATGINAVTIGSGATNSGNDALVFGSNALNSGQANSVGIGSFIVLAGIGQENVAIGFGSQVSSASRSVAIGRGAAAFASESVAIGDGANANSGVGNIAIGDAATCGTGVSNIALGDGAGTGGASTNAIAIGTGAVASPNNGIAIGNLAIVHPANTDGVAIGENAQAGNGGGGGAVAIGSDATAGFGGCVAIGDGALASGTTFNIAIGFGASSTGSSGGGIAIGLNTVTSGQFGVVIGRLSTLNNANSAIAIGNGATVPVGGDNSVVIGFGLTGVGINTVGIGTSNGNRFDLSATGRFSLTGTGAMFHLPNYSVLALPTAANLGGFIYVTDESGGAVPAFSDGANWRRVTDRAIVT